MVKLNGSTIPSRSALGLYYPPGIIGVVIFFILLTFKNIACGEMCTKHRYMVQLIITEENPV